MVALRSEALRVRLPYERRLIAEFYLVDRGLRHLTQGLSLRRVSAGSGVGSIGIDPHRARSLLRDRKYLVDRGLRHRLPGFSSMGRLFDLVDRGLRNRLPGFSS